LKAKPDPKPYERKPIKGLKAEKPLQEMLELAHFLLREGKIK
jgi:hypothetical protein